MLQLIAFIVFIFSLAGIAFILARKIPVLNTLPQNGTTGLAETHIVLGLQNRVKAFVLTIEKQLFLHKFLSWIKVMTLKIEVRIDHMLHGIRKKAQKIDKDLNAKK